MIGGRLTRDPVRYNAGKHTVIKPAIRERTNFISIPIWGQQAKMFVVILKSRYVIVEGRRFPYDKGEGDRRKPLLW